MSGRRIVPRALPRTVPVLAALTLATVLTTGCSTPEPHVTRTAEAADDLVRGEPAPSAASPYWVDP
ncbi:endoglucanase, partial [Streptomyces anulatus]